VDDILDAVIQAFDEQRRRLRAELDDIDRKEAAVRAAMDHHTIDRKPSVPEDKYEEVLRFLEKHPNSRQADIAKNLQLNSGIISQAMKIAVEQGQAQADRQGRGARYSLTGNGRKK
jgi:hypothetical protein